MPYTIANPPDKIADLPKEAQKVWVEAFNNAYDNYDKEKDDQYDENQTESQNRERYSNAVAYSAVQKAGYKTQSDKGQEVVFGLRTSDNHQWLSILNQSFKKQIVKFGTWIDPFNPKLKMKLDKSWGERVVENFKKGVLGRIPVPLTHTDDPERNKGEVVDMELGEDGIYATLDIRDDQVAKDIKQDRIWDVSIGFYNEYLDKQSGDNVGPAIFHVALVNNPYLKGMKPFQALADNIKASVIMLSEEHIKELSMKKVTNTRDFPVEVSYKNDKDEEVKLTLKPGDEIEVSDDDTTVESQITEATAPVGGDDDGGAGNDPKNTDPQGNPVDDKNDPTGKNPELSEENAKLKKQLAERDANDAYQKLLGEGKITPAQKDAFIALATADAGQIKLSDGKEVGLSELVVKLMSSAKRVVSFDEKGSGSDEQTPSAKLSDEERATFDKLGVKPEEYDEEVKEGNIKLEDEES